jgi:hypothetical protein
LFQSSQDLSLAEEKLGDFHNKSEAHRKRELALEELLRIASVNVLQMNEADITVGVVVAAVHWAIAVIQHSESRLTGK